MSTNPNVCWKRACKKKIDNAVVLVYTSQKIHLQLIISYSQGVYAMHICNKEISQDSVKVQQYPSLLTPLSWRWHCYRKEKSKSHFASLFWGWEYHSSYPKKMNVILKEDLWCKEKIDTVKSVRKVAHIYVCSKYMNSLADKSKDLYMYWLLVG